MANKMYILLEADQSRPNPLSSLVNQLVEQLKISPAVVKEVSSTHKEEHPSSPSHSRGVNISESDNHKLPQSHHQASDHSSSDRSHKVTHTKYQPTPAHGEKRYAELVVLQPDAAITAEACVEPDGRAKAKVSVTSKHNNLENAIAYKPPSKEQAPDKDEFPFCGKRNGLDPTCAEMRGSKKFEYLPYKSKIPEYKGKCAKVKTIAISDHLSSFSTTSRYSAGLRSKRSFNTGWRPDCLKNIPEARLKKYNACITRKNGLQDRCDPVSRNAVKNCCDSKKRYKDYTK